MVFIQLSKIWAFKALIIKYIQHLYDTRCLVLGQCITVSPIYLWISDNLHDYIHLMSVRITDNSVLQALSLKHTGKERCLKGIFMWQEHNFETASQSIPTSMQESQDYKINFFISIEIVSHKNTHKIWYLARTKY